MGSDSLFLKDPTSSRFLSGGLPEAEGLLGSPLPSLPLPDVEGGRPVYHVKFHPQLRNLLMRYLLSLLREIGADLPGAPRAQANGKEALEYEVTLERMMRAVRVADRRVGLVNLCWLAHSRDVAECLRELEGKYPSVKKLKYSLHPLLSSFYKRLDQVVRRDGGAGRPRARVVPGRGARERLPGRRHHRGRLRLHRAEHLRVRLQRLPRLQQALPPGRGPLLRDVLRPAQGDGAPAARERPRVAGARGPPSARPGQGAAPDPGRHREGHGERAGPHLSAGRRLDHRGQAARRREAARGGGAPPLRGDHRGVPRRGQGREALRADLAPARPDHAHEVRRPRRGRSHQPRTPHVRVQRRGPGPQQRRQRDRALPGPARVHPDLRGPHLGARPDPGALHRVRRLHPPRAAASGARWTRCSGTGS